MQNDVASSDLVRPRGLKKITTTTMTTTTTTTTTMTMVVMIIAMTMVLGASAKDITCTATAKRNVTTVVCHFGVDIQREGLSFNVHYYPPSSQLAEPVLRCNHDANDKQLVCTHQGYSVTGTDVTLTHTQPAPVAEQALRRVGGGQYLCQLISGPADVKPQFCNVTYEEDTGPVTGSTTTHDPPASQSSAGFAVQVVICVAVVFIAVVLLVVLIMCCCACRYRIRLIRWWGEQKEKAAFRDPINPEVPPTHGPSVDVAATVQEEVASTGRSGLLSCFRGQQPTEGDSDKNKQGGEMEEGDKKGEGEGDKMLDGQDAKADKAEEKKVTPTSGGGGLLSCFRSSQEATSDNDKRGKTIEEKMDDAKANKPGKEEEEKMLATQTDKPVAENAV